jgi:acetate kinase
VIPVLVLNAGSSSLKYQLIDMSEDAADRVTASGLVERIGEAEGRLVHRASGADELTEEGAIPDHGAALDRVLAAFERTGGLTEAPFAVGHRVVHGGDRFSGPTVVDDDVLAEIRDLVPLAPLHNPANIAGIEVARSRYPDTPQVAVFDTAFHAAMPPHAWRYRCRATWRTGCGSAGTASTGRHTATSRAPPPRTWAVRSTSWRW